jgi:ATP-dependent protease ClpP protease subunit
MEIPKDCPLVYVSFSAEINPSTTESLIAVMANCANAQVRTVYLLLSTPGGKVMNGMNLYHVLIGMPFELVTHNVGNVDSVGNVIFLSGKKRYATPNATFMFHGVGFDMPPNQRLEEKDCRQRLDSILSDQKRMGNIIAQHTSLSDGEIAELFKEAQTKDANFAVDKGIIHEIKELQITTGSPIISLVFKR